MKIREASFSDWRNWTILIIGVALTTAGPLLSLYNYIPSAWMPSIIMAILVYFVTLIYTTFKLVENGNNIIDKIKDATDKLTSADSFFKGFRHLAPLFDERLGAAVRCIICAPFPYEILKKHRHNFEKILARGGTLVFILPESGSHAEQMAMARADPCEREFRKSHALDFLRQLIELKNASIGKPGRLSLLSTAYWPNYILTYMKGSRDADAGAIFVTINNYDQPDVTRLSFVLEGTKDPNSFNSFMKDIENIKGETKSIALP
jgi:hypothetical protein